MHTANSSDSAWGFYLTVYAGFPLPTLCLSIVTNGETDLSLMGRCPASSQPKARHLSPLCVISHVTATLRQYPTRFRRKKCSVARGRYGCSQLRGQPSSSWAVYIPRLR